MSEWLGGKMLTVHTVPEQLLASAKIQASV